MKQIEVIQAILERPQGAVLAVIAAVDGPSYRPVGAMMAIFGANDYVGSLSSGCVEADVTLHAQNSLRAGKPQIVLYGRGSPFLDIQLPCGGGLHIVLVPNPNLGALAQIVFCNKQRKKCTVQIDIDTGAISVETKGKTQLIATTLSVEIVPDIQFIVFGKGPETSTFVSLVVSADFPAILLSPDDETLASGQSSGSETRKLSSKSFPTDLRVDDRSAIVLFFHDHDWEPPILIGALETPAFYIGAQGSLRARDTRFAALNEFGATGQQLERLHGPIGLISSARDPITLAISVLAEIVDKAAEEINLDVNAVV